MIQRIKRLSPNCQSRCIEWDGSSPRRQHIALSRWADQEMSGALVQNKAAY